MNDFESYHATTDTSTTLAYHTLDFIYPGSKFILTERADIETWLDSCQALWENQFDKWLPKIHNLHLALYRTKVFDRDRLRVAYIKHGEEVREYFQGRDRDFLEFTTETDGWETLCTFLGKDVRTDDFPHENARGNISFERNRVD
jgi:hypothetical protein